jgi:hypothetical protein
MKQLFELALQLEPPWRVAKSDIDFERRRVDLRLGFRAGSRQSSSPGAPGDSRT